MSWNVWDSRIQLTELAHTFQHARSNTDCRLDGKVGRKHHYIMSQFARTIFFLNNLKIDILNYYLTNNLNNH